MTEVRRHQRQTASGKTANVRHHTRGTGEAAERKRQAWEDRAAARWIPPPPAASVTSAPEDEAQEWWAEDGTPPPGEFWDDEHAPETDKDSAHLHPEWAAIPVNRAPAYRPQGDYDFAKPEETMSEDPKATRKAAAARLKAARADLAAHYTDTEDDEYLRLNRAVIDAEKDVPWWRRG